MKETIKCFCENEIEVEFADEVDFTEEVISSILDGTFQNISCAACGTVLKPEFPTLFSDKTSGKTLYFLPEIERNAYFSGKKDAIKSDRIAIGYRELLEKIQIHKAVLDDRIIEMIKYFYLEKAPSELDLQIYFSRREAESLYFHIHGLKPDEVGETGIGFSFYEKLEADIEKMVKTKPFDTFLSPPYVSIKKIYLED